MESYIKMTPKSQIKWEGSRQSNKHHMQEWIRKDIFLILHVMQLNKF